MKLATYCCLLVTLAGTTALVQTHPKQKTVHKQAVVRKQFSPRLSMAEREPWPYLVEDYLHCDLKTVVAEPLDSNKVYVYVEQMPTLNGQNAFAASIAAITQHLVIPPTSPNGRVFVRFEVNKRGSVSHPKIVKGLRTDVDSAVVAATRQLPRFTPGKQNGRVVTVSLTLPITIQVAKQL